MITSAVDISMDGVVVSPSNAISNIFSVVVSTPSDVSVIVSGNMRDSGGMVVVIPSAVWASVVLEINVVLWSGVVEVIDSIVISNASTSVVEGMASVVVEMASVVVSFRSILIVVLSVTIWIDSVDVEIEVSVDVPVVSMTMTVVIFRVVDDSVVGPLVIVKSGSDVISSPVVSSTISEGSIVVVGKVSVEAPVSSPTDVIPVTISDVIVVDSIVSVDVLEVIVVISGNMEDSEGKVVDITTVVCRVELKVVLWSWVVEVIDSIVVSSSPTSVVVGDNVLAINSVLSVIFVDVSVISIVAEVSAIPSVGPVVVKTGAIVSISGLVVTLPSITIFAVVSSVGRVCVEVNGTFVDMSVITSVGIVVAIESTPMSVVISGNIRDSEGKVVVITFVV